MKGVLRFGFTAVRLHCEATVQESEPCGKKTPPLRPGLGLTAGSQLRLEGPKVGAPRLMVPPKVPPAGQVPPVGTVVRQAAEGSAATFPGAPFWGPLSMNILA